MIRYELIKRISDKFGVEEIEAGVFVDRIFGAIVEAFKKGKKINIPEFGKFNVTYKTVDGVKQRYVSFSPAKNFADSVNKNFSDLEPLVVNAFNVKNKELLKVKEIFPERDEEEYLYFEFVSSVDETDLEDIPDAGLITEKISNEDLPVIEDVPVIEESPEKIPDDEITEIAEEPRETATLNSLVDQDVFTESAPVIEDEINEEAKTEEIKFDEETVATVISQQTVFADNPVDIILPEGLLLKDFNENPEEQIAENEKIIEEVNNISSLSIRVILKDDMNIDNIKEEIFDILVRREEIIKELKSYDIPEEVKNEEVRTIPEIEEAIRKPEEPAEIIEEPVIKESPKVEDDSSDLFAELEKRIKELDELSHKEEVLKADLKAPMSQEMQIFGKLIDDAKPEIKEEELHEIFSEIIIHDPVPEVKYEEPKSLADALQDIKLDGVIEHMDAAQGDAGVKSYDDIFSKKEHQFVPQYAVAPEEKMSQGKFFKIFLYLFFIFLLSAFSFYIYKTMFTKSTGNQVVDTIGVQRLDSVRALLKKTADSTAKKDTSKMIAEEESGQTESVEKKNLYGVIYRELGNKIYIQNKVLDDLNVANELEAKLKSNNLNCIIEGATKIDNGLEYRVLVGPFVNLEEAMAYYENHKVILNFIQIMHSNRPNLLVF